MKSLNLTVRNNKTKHYARSLRNQGVIPGVLYGKGIQNLLFEIGELELNNEINRSGEHSKLEVSIGGENIKAIVKEVQRDPATKKILHIDLEKIERNQMVEMDVPIVFSNVENIVKSGGIVQKEKEKIRIRCSEDKLPKYINAPMTRGQIGTVIRVEDLEVGEEITFMENLKSVIASINYVKSNDETPDNEAL